MSKNYLQAKYRRVSGIRDPRLIIIATEGEKTEPEYFDELVSKENYYNPRVQVETVPCEDHRSAPRYVLAKLNECRRKYDIKEFDQLWLVIDSDRWTNADLNYVAEECEKEGYHIALSNPCFELWMLLHFTDITKIAPEKLRSLCCDKESIKEMIKRSVKTFKKNEDLHISIFMPNVKRAITNAKKIDKNPQDRWPLEIGTRVYILVDTIIP